jgi:hypothetical protein
MPASVTRPAERLHISSHATAEDRSAAASVVAPGILILNQVSTKPDMGKNAANAEGLSLNKRGGAEARYIGRK